MNAPVIGFPRWLAAVGAVLICETADGFLVLTPRHHGWLHATLAAARRDAAWLAENLGGLPIRELV